MPRLPFPKPNPITISIDKIAFNNTALGDLKSASLWPQSVVSDTLRADFTIANNSQDVTISYSVVTGAVFDGDVKVMSSGYSKNDFFSPSGTIDYPIGPGERAQGDVLLKWDSIWVSRRQAPGYCLLVLQLWRQNGEYNPDQGDLLFTVPNQDYHPNAPQTPDDPNYPLPVQKPTKAIVFHELSNVVQPIDIYPGCSRGEDFLAWPELSARIFQNGQEIDLLPFSYQNGVRCQELIVPDGVAIALSWKVTSGGFPSLDDHPGSISKITISGPGIVGEFEAHATQTEAGKSGVTSKGEVADHVQIGGIRVVEAIQPYVLTVRGHCGQVQAFTILLPEIPPPADKTPWQNWAENQSSVPELTFDAVSVEHIVAIIQQAEKKAEKVRAVGSAWSFSNIAVTDHYLVQTSGLNRTLGWSGGPRLPNCPTILQDALVQAARGRKLYHVEAGITIRELSTRLDNQSDQRGVPLDGSNAFAKAKDGLWHPFMCAQFGAIQDILATDWSHDPWALPTMGGSGGQTLAGRDFHLRSW